MDLSKTNQILRVAKMYYEEHLSQQDIAKIEEISTATVSRLLKRAEELGFIKISIVQPFYSTADLETAVKNRYALKKVTVIPDLINNRNALIRDINKQVLEDLNKLTQNGDTIGLAWGETMTALAKEAEEMQPFDKSDMSIVQLYGGISPLIDRAESPGIIQSISRLFNAEAYQVCAPAYVGNEQTAALLKNEYQIASVLEKGKNCKVAVFSAGPVDENGFIFSLGSLKGDTFELLRQKNTLGDVCLHFLDDNGDLSDPELDKRSISISLEELKKIPEKVLVAYDLDKAPIIKTALENGLVDRLYVNEELAKTLLK